MTFVGFVLMWLLIFGLTGIVAFRQLPPEMVGMILGAALAVFILTSLNRISSRLSSLKVANVLSAEYREGKADGDNIDATE